MQMLLQNIPTTYCTIMPQWLMVKTELQRYCNTDGRKARVIYGIRMTKLYSDQRVKCDSQQTEYVLEPGIVGGKDSGVNMFHVNVRAGRLTNIRA